MHERFTSAVGRLIKTRLVTSKAPQGCRAANLEGRRSLQVHFRQSIEEQGKVGNLQPECHLVVRSRSDLLSGREVAAS